MRLTFLNNATGGANMLKTCPRQVVQCYDGSWFLTSNDGIDARFWDHYENAMAPTYEEMNIFWNYYRTISNIINTQSHEMRRRILDIVNDSILVYTIENDPNPAIWMDSDPAYSLELVADVALYEIMQTIDTACGMDVCSSIGRCIAFFCLGPLGVSEDVIEVIFRHNYTNLKAITSLRLCWDDSYIILPEVVLFLNERLTQDNFKELLLSTRHRWQEVFGHLAFVEKFSRSVDLVMENVPDDANVRFILDGYSRGELMVLGETIVSAESI